MKKILFFLLMTLLCQLTKAQNTIKGIVTDLKNEPLIGANIYISDLTKGTVTNQYGEYELSNLPNGKFMIKFSFIGYENQIETVELNQSKIELNISLKETAIEAEEVVVSGGYNSTQHQNAVKIDVLKIIPVQSITTSNFTEVLTKVPGVDMISKGSGVSKPVIRGLAMNDILVLNHGVRFENYQYSDHHPLGIDEFGIEDIEIIKGPASLLYGSDAIGGVINFIKEKPAPVGKIEGDYNMQLFSNSLGITNNIGIKGASTKFHASIRFGNKTNADYLQGGGNFVPNTRFFGNSLKANAGFNNQNMSLNFFYEYSMNKIGLAEPEAIEYVLENGRSRKPEVFYMQIDNQILAVQNKFFFNKYKLEINGAYQKAGLIHVEGLNDISIDMSLQTLTYEMRLYFPSHKNTEYIVGFQGLNQTNSNHNNREIILLPKATTNNYSCFGLLQYTFFEKLKIQSGIRYDLKQISTKSVNFITDPEYRPSIDKKYESFSGSLGATYNYYEKILFRFNFAAAYRTPNLAELTSNGQHETRYEIGNQNLIPENAYETDFSIHYHTDIFTFDIAAYYNSINNYIYISPTGDATSNGLNIYKYLQSNVFLYGVESGFHLHPKNIEWLHFQTTFSTVTGKKTNGEFLPLIPANKLNFELQTTIEKILIFGNAFFKLNSTTAFAQNNITTDETSTSGYTLLDCGIGADIKIKNQVLAFSFSINNIFDKKYIDHLSTLKETGYYNQGRNFVLSLKIPFGIK